MLVRLNQVVADKLYQLALPLGLLFRTSDLLKEVFFSGKDDFNNFLRFVELALDLRGKVNEELVSFSNEVSLEKDVLPILQEEEHHTRLRCLCPPQTV